MLAIASSDCRRSVDTVDSQPRRGSPGVAVVDGGRVFGVLPQRRASTGGATPSRLAAAMESGIVGQLPQRRIGGGMGGVGGTVPCVRLAGHTA